MDWKQIEEVYDQCDKEDDAEITKQLTELNGKVGTINVVDVARLYSYTNIRFSRTCTVDSDRFSFLCQVYEQMPREKVLASQKTIMDKSRLNVQDMTRLYAIRVRLDQLNTGTRDCTIQ